MIDPHEEYFQFKGDRTSGYAWRLVEKRDVMKQIPDQFEPYIGILDCTNDTFDSGYYKGTLFRFPFRREASQLSDTIYDDQRIMSLFDAFKSDAPTLLLFLKNLERIEIFKRSAGQQDLTLLYEVKIADRNLKSTKFKRQEFVNQCMDRPNPAGVTQTYQLHIETVDYMSKSTRNQLHQWLVTEHRAGSNISSTLTKLSQDESLSLVPLVGVALQIHSSAIVHQDPRPKPPDGQIFCFLPLPVEQQTATGLPVHVNGYFAISQNRRHLKWPTTGFRTETDKSVQWNQCLLTELIPEAYTQLVLHAVKLCQNSALMSIHDVYNVIPNRDSVYSQWEVVLTPLFKRLANKSLVRTESGNWCLPQKVLFDCLAAEDDRTRSVVTGILQSCKVDVARVPMHAYNALQEISGNCLQHIQPNTVRDAIRNKPRSYGNLKRDDKLRLLKYLMTDEQYQDLKGNEKLLCI